MLREELDEKNEKLKATEKDLNLCEDNLVSDFDALFRIVKFNSNICLFFFQTSTRINYEEQISVMTEQILSLSDQLASRK